MQIIVSRSSFIHFIRWVSALLVVMNHLRSLMFQDFGTLPRPGVLLKGFYFITSLGHDAVVVFFVLSGYLIGKSVTGQLKAGRFQVKDYLLARVSRLYAVLPVALLLTGVFDFTGHYFNQVGIYTNKVYSASLNFNVMNRENFSHFLASLLMLQNIVLPPLGSNGPLWSLNYEFWYYLLFPLCCLLVIGLMKKQFKPVFWLSAVVIAFIMLLLNADMRLYYLIWLAGLLPLLINTNYRWLRWLLVPGIFIYLMVTRVHLLYSAFITDLVLGVLVALLLTTFPNRDVKNVFYKFNASIAGFSYTLYLVHYPFCLCVLALVNRLIGLNFKAFPSPALLLLFTGLIGLTLLFSALIAGFTEYKTEKFKHVLMKLGNKVKYRFSTNRAVSPQ